MADQFIVVLDLSCKYEWQFSHVVFGVLAIDLRDIAGESFETICLFDLLIGDLFSLVGKRWKGTRVSGMVDVKTG